MKRFFTAFGAASALVIVSMLIALTVIASKAVIMADQNKLAAVAAVQEISKDWSVDNRDHLVASSLISIAKTPKGNQAFKILSRLGKLVTVDDVAQTNFGMSTETGTTATITFQGMFTNGVAKMVVRLREIDGTMKIIGLRTTETRLNRTPKNETA